MISLRLVEEEGIEHVVEELRVILVQLEGQKLLNQITSCESDYLKIRKKNIRGSEILYVQEGL